MERNSSPCAEVKAAHVDLLKTQILGGSPIGRRPTTRSMSPMKSPDVTFKASPWQKQGSVPQGVTTVSPSTRRPTRFATAEARASRNNQLERTTACNSMNKKLFSSVEGIDETEQQRQRWDLIRDCPSFDLGLEDSPSDECVAPETGRPVEIMEQPVIICSNEDSGDSLDKIYASIEMPTGKPDSENMHEVQTKPISPNAPNSVTPIPQAHQKRVLKPGPSKKSPFLGVERKAIASRTTTGIYNKVCAYTGKDVNDPTEEPIIIDDGKWYIHLKDLADLVRPGAQLSNCTCEMALNAMSTEMAQQKKFLMPLRIATKLRSATCFMDSTVKKAFENSPANRLDHKEMIMFPVLQNLTPNIKVTTGHYYLIVLNLKAERFEVMDSLRREGDKGLQGDYRLIIGSIKNMWARNYNQSKFNISKYKTVHIPTPM